MLKLNYKMKYYLLLFAFFILFIQGSCDPDPPPPPPPPPPPVDNTEVTIVDGSVTESESSQELTIIVRILSDYEGAITLNYNADDRSAFSAYDYEDISGTLLFTSPETEKEITLTILGDEIKEGDEEFNIQLSTTDAVEFIKDKAVIRISDNDSLFPTGSSDGYATSSAYEKWDLSWQDEFDAEINLDYWNFEIGTGNGGWGNNELEYYTAREENVRIENGKLVIEARKEDYLGSKYTSTRMTTLGKKSFDYSRVDVRAKLPEGQGIWPAIWMLGRNFEEVGWPSCGEIDIMELVGHEPSKSHSTLHFGPDFGAHQYKGQSISLPEGNKFSDEFHVFSVVREKDQMWFYVDDILFYDFDRLDVGNAGYPFNDRFFFILNVAVGGNWPGNPNANTVFPQTLEVDYIRVFEKKPL